MQQVFELADPPLDEREFFGLLNLVGGILPVADGVLGGLQPGQQALASFLELGDLRRDALPPLI